MQQLPATNEMARAVRNSDAGYDGVFYVAVRTTGIFCRPSCRARKPRPEGKAIALPAHAVGLAWPGAAVLGAGRALSSTAIVLPVVGECGLLASTAGRDGRYAPGHLLLRGGGNRGGAARPGRAPQAEGLPRPHGRIR